VYEGPGRLAVRDIPVPEAEEGWTLVKTAYAGICGSDMTIYAGKHPRAKSPLVLGHEFSGYIASENPDFEPGALVTVYPYLYCGKCEICESGFQNACRLMRLIGIDLDGGMAEYVRVPNDSIYAAPDGVSPKLAAFVEPCGISVHAMRHGGYRPGDSVAVFGAGPIGLATAITLRESGAKNLWVLEVGEKRRMLARSLGFHTIDSGRSAAEEIRERTDGLGVDCVFDCAGHQSVVDAMPDAVKIGGTAILVAGYKTPPVVDFQKGMMREFSIRFVRNCKRRDFRTAMGLVSSCKDYEALLTNTFPIDGAQAGFDLMAKPDGAMKILFEM
jgi:2-desacetyl-2-hydroxyethyl bacteriochlorophyllide A dehydrogenase